VKRNSEVGARMFDALIVDGDTRWDSKLSLLERTVHFDAEILQLQRQLAETFPAECLLSRQEFDIAIGMTYVLLPFRIFTKFFENRSVVTLAHLPHKVDELLSSLAPGSYAQRMQGRDPQAIVEVENFQLALARSVRERFAYVFGPDSIALEALMLMPGPNRFQFVNFLVPPDVIAQVRTRLLDDVVELLPSNMTPEIKAQHRTLADATLTVARSTLDTLEDTEDPLECWPSMELLAPLHPVAQMLLAIPASTSEDERSFSSAGLTLGKLRTRMDLDNYRREQRVRQYLTSGTDPQSQAGRQERLNRSNTLIERFALIIQAAKARQVAQAAAQAPPH